jgi:uncharacterized protein involved in exopolysaccharide biosynthesis
MPAMTPPDHATPANSPRFPQHASDRDEEISLLDWLIVIARRKRLIIGGTVVGALVAAGVSLKLPDIYTATATFLPPQQNQSSANALLSQFGGFSGLAGVRPGLKNPDDLYIAILKSRNVLEKVAKRFDLQNVYGAKTPADAIQNLQGRVTAVSSKDGIIAVGVDDRDPKRAADMANAIIEELDKSMQTFSLTEASRRRGFFEQQLRDARNKLTDAELQVERTRNTSMQYLDALRNMKYVEAIYEILTKQYEVSKLDEAKNYPIIQVVDKAEIPEAKSRPRRTWIVVMAAAASLFLSVFLAILMEKLERGWEDPQQRERLARLKKSLSLR